MTAVFPYRKLPEPNLTIEPWPPVEARYFRITFPEPGKILLKVGPGDHSVKVYELTKDDLRSLILDGLPELLGG